MIDSMVLGRLYFCRKEVRIKGRLADGREAFSLVPEGSPVVPVVGPEGKESILIDGGVVQFSWSSTVWSNLFKDEGDV